jgi:hypothetical protein
MINREQHGVEEKESGVNKIICSAQLLASNHLSIEMTITNTAAPQQYLSFASSFCLHALNVFMITNHQRINHWDDCS